MSGLIFAHISFCSISSIMIIIFTHIKFSRIYSPARNAQKYVLRKNFYFYSIYIYIYIYTLYKQYI